MANWRGGISGIWACMQYATPTITARGQYYSTHLGYLGLGANWASTLHDTLGITFPVHGVSKNNKYLVRSWEYGNCMGRDTGLWGGTHTFDKNIYISETGVRAAYFGFKISPMWRGSHRSGSNVYATTHFYIYNKAGNLIGQSGPHTRNVSPESFGEWTPAWSNATSEDIGRIRMTSTVNPSDNSWHDLGDRGFQRDYTPEFYLGHWRAINMSEKYPYWVAPSNAGSSERYVVSDTFNTYVEGSNTESKTTGALHSTERILNFHVSSPSSPTVEHSLAVACDGYSHIKVGTNANIRGKASRNHSSTHRVSNWEYTGNLTSTSGRFFEDYTDYGTDLPNASAPAWPTSTLDGLSTSEVHIDVALKSIPTTGYKVFYNKILFHTENGYRGFMIFTILLYKVNSTVYILYRYRWPCGANDGREHLRFTSNTRSRVIPYKHN